MNIERTSSDIDLHAHILAKYEIKSKTTIKAAAYEIALGQSIGNPNLRSKWETQELIDDYACKILDIDEINGQATLAFPSTLWNPTDGLSHLMCIVMGGQVDIDNIQSCRLVALHLPVVYDVYGRQPAMGMSGLRKLANVYDRPLLGGIIKPKTGISPETLLDIVKEMVDGGINFIKEDEILSNIPTCDFFKRVELIADYILDKPVVYCASITSTFLNMMARSEHIYNTGLYNFGVHVNIWAGMSAYHELRSHFPKLFIHFQKSGDAVFTHPNNTFSVSWEVICYLASFSGVDSIHVGMLNGYKNDSIEDITRLVRNFNRFNIISSVSCGLSAKNVNSITEILGNDYMASSGGAIHSHPSGTRAGTAAIIHAMTQQFDSPEYKEALNV